MMDWWLRLIELYMNGRKAKSGKRLRVQAGNSVRSSMFIGNESRDKRTP